jgi:hypothetical protein
MQKVWRIRTYCKNAVDPAFGEDQSLEPQVPLDTAFGEDQSLLPQVPLDIAFREDH